LEKNWVLGLELPSGREWQSVGNDFVWLSPFVALTEKQFSYRPQCVGNECYSDDTANNYEAADDKPAVADGCISV
jgi:hypothetical protein